MLKSKSKPGKGRRQKDHKRESTTPLRRRGTISSMTTQRRSRKKINLADEGFTVGDTLSRLVEEVFAPPIETDTTYASESGSNKAGTSIIRRLGKDICRVQIKDTSESGGEGFKVKTKEGNCSNLGEFDILCTSEIRLHVGNHVGNNRFRTMLQMNRRSFHNPNSTQEQKLSICQLISEQVMSGKKGRGRFLRERDNVWVEMNEDEVRQAVLYFMQQCVDDPGLGLPTLHQAFSKSLLEPFNNESPMSYRALHNIALES